MPCRKHQRLKSWLEFAAACKYLDHGKFTELDKEYENIIGMLSRMEEMSSKFCCKKD